VQPREGRDLDLAAIEAHLRQHLAGYKVPRSVWLVDAIRRAPSGKPDYGWARRYATSRPASAEHSGAERSGADRASTAGQPAG
jgi:acyl-CoA synthetase (AMP-forming)/AMP-acid ligase II